MMEVGKLYRSSISGTVVRCLAIGSTNYFVQIVRKDNLIDDNGREYLIEKRVVGTYTEYKLPIERTVYVHLFTGSGDYTVSSVNKNMESSIGSVKVTVEEGTFAD